MSLYNSKNENKYINSNHQQSLNNFTGSLTKQNRPLLKENILRNNLKSNETNQTQKINFNSSQPKLTTFKGSNYSFESPNTSKERIKSMYYLVE